jgi:hypothetical protein
LVARLFQRLLAIIYLIAWASLGVQVRELIGARGLLPAADFFAAARGNGASLTQLPSVFWFGAYDTLLVAGVWVGGALSLCALLGWYPRLCFALSSVLYLSYVTAARTFLSFQWDNLLLEAGTLAVLLPTDRDARWAHVLFRVLLFKLYWESGIAKWQSHLGDWQDGSAMTYYYETAPLPTWVAWYAHALPETWHHLESRAVLVLELVLPMAIFGPRWCRLVVALLFTGFQLANIVTANYGFFAYLTIVLHVFLLGDRDAARFTVWRRAGASFRWRAAPVEKASVRPPTLRWLSPLAATVVVLLYGGISFADAWLQFGQPPPAWRTTLATMRRFYAPWRLINTYHLFGHITRERIEPEIQTFDGREWQPHLFRHKPGDVSRAPDFVAPHQPRLDFQLWFYGLDFRRGTPQYVGALVDRLCHDPRALQRLFRTPLPWAPDAVRIVFWRYHFTTPDERQRSGAWWKRDQVATSRALSCR